MLCVCVCAVCVHVLRVCAGDAHVLLGCGVCLGYPDRQCCYRHQEKHPFVCVCVCVCAFFLFCFPFLSNDILP